MGLKAWLRVRSNKGSGGVDGINLDEFEADCKAEDSQIVACRKRVPQGSARRPLLANLYLHYCMDQWLSIYHPEGPFERYADDAIIHCRSKRQAEQVREHLQARMRVCGLELHPEKTHMVYAPAVTVVVATGRYRLRSLVIHLPQGWPKTAAVRCARELVAGC